VVEAPASQPASPRSSLSSGPRSGPPGVHVLALAVRFGDCDPAGIVYFPRYFDFFHQAMETWFPAELGLGYDTFVREHKLGIPSVHSEADFAAPSRFGETIEVHLRVTKLGRSSIEFAYEVYGPDPDLVGPGPQVRRVTGRSVCVVMDLDPSSPDSNKAVAIPAQLRARIESFGISPSPASP
jgi:4-hydroxybenzoyl-CoA thioesterase